MKAMGVGIILSAVFFFSLTLTGRRKAEINCLDELCRGMELIRAELGTRLTPMPELLRILSDRCRGEAGAFFSALCKAMPLLEENEFSKLWNIAADTYLKPLHPEELNTVKKVGAVLGKYELSEQLAVTDACRRELAFAAEKLRASYPESRRLFFGISAAAGGFLIILLL